LPEDFVQKSRNLEGVSAETGKWISELQSGRFTWNWNLKWKYTKSYGPLSCSRLAVYDYDKVFYSCQYLWKHIQIQSRCIECGMAWHIWSELHNLVALVMIGAVFSVRLRQKTYHFGEATVMTNVLS